MWKFSFLLLLLSFCCCRIMAEDVAQDQSSVMPNDAVVNNDYETVETDEKVEAENFSKPESNIKSEGPKKTTFFLRSLKEYDTLEVNGITYHCFQFFKVSTLKVENVSDMPENGIGLLGEYVIYKTDDERPDYTLAFLLKDDSSYGKVLLNKIYFTCKNEKPKCSPLGKDYHVNVIDFDTKMYEVIVKDVAHWDYVYKILKTNRYVDDVLASLDDRIRFNIIYSVKD